MKLNDPSIKFISLGVKQNSNAVANWLNANGYDVVKFNQVHLNEEKICWMGISTEKTNNDVRFDAIKLLFHLNESMAIVKYGGEYTAKGLYANGSEFIIGIDKWDDNPDKNTWGMVREGLFFSFKKKKRYYYIKEENELSKNLIVEIKDNKGNWKERLVLDPELEWENMYQLLSKYERVRIAQ